MQNIIIIKTDDLYKLAESIRVADETDIVFVVPADVQFLRNTISFKFLEHQADLFGKKISFVNENREPVSFIEPQRIENVPKVKKESEEVKSDSGFKISSVLKNAVFLILGFALLVGVGVGFWWVFPKAKVVINVNSEILVKNVDVIANVKANSVNESNKEVPAVLLEASRKLGDSIQTSGEKEVGEKAKGTVKIYNKTPTKKVFGKGTKLVLISAESEDLNFYTQAEVTVEEKSEIAGGITYGSLEVEVEAEKFGLVYNVKEDEKFKIEDQDTSDFLAQNEKAFVGGSSKKVPAVSEKDKEALKKVLEDKLKVGVKADLESKLVGEQKIAENSINFETFDEVFDKNVGDEADKLSLSLQVRAYALVYYQNDLEKVVKSVLERSVPEQYSLSDTETRFEIGNVLADKPTPSSKDKLNLLVKVRSFVVPKVNEQEIRDNVVNRKVKDAQSYLDGLKNVNSYELIVWPRFPGFLSTTPHIKSRISVEIKNE